MKQYIKNLFSEKTQNSNPSTNTDLANSLELLSSGIYTEEERFIFELLQNAVDAHDDDSEELNIHIDIHDSYLIFMHNGTPFTGRDIEGICSVGNGNKSKDIKKIGYKGIGFKSVFMHSNLVYIKSENTIFRFDKEFWDNPANVPYENKTSESGREYKMPWQIIPIYTEDLPFDIDSDGYNVCTLICSDDIISLTTKVENLFCDCQFLLFLRNSNISIELYENSNIVKSVGKSSQEFTELENGASQSQVSLYVNGEQVSKWLIYKNEEVEVPVAVRNNIRKDPKTPQKLQDAETFDISFGIALNERGDFSELSNAVLYTYLPTSCHFGLPFLVNANFMTDAGRQQLVSDSEWNKMIVTAIPCLYLKWVATLSSQHSEYVDILPPLTISYKVLGDIFSTALQSAIENVAFIPTLEDDSKKNKVAESLIDSIELHNAFSKKRFTKFVEQQFSPSFSTESLISSDHCGRLKEYGVKYIEQRDFVDLLSASNEFLSELAISECADLCTWMNHATFLQDQQSIKFLSESSFLLDEEESLTAPASLFFPSKYREENELAQSAKVLSEELLNELMSRDLKEWLAKLGVQAMSNLSVVKNVLCKEGYINKNNAIEVLQFIFDCEQKEHVLDSLSVAEKSTFKVLTSESTLEKADDLFLDKLYGIQINGDISMLKEYFVSSKYVRPGDEILKWQIFFRRIGVNTDMCVKKRTFNSKSQLYDMFRSYVDFCSTHEKNYGYPIHRCGYFVHIYIQAQLPPILNFVSDSFSKSQFVWSNTMAFPLKIDEREDFIAGHTGWNYYAHGYFVDNIEGHRYIGENVLPFILKTRSVLPGTDGQLHKSVELLAPTDENKNLYSNYLPTLSVLCSIEPSWREILHFKERCSLEDCLSVLTRISQETDDEKKKGNVERISLLYRHICDNFDLSENSSNLGIIQRWGQVNKIMSVDKAFESPSNLVMISDDLGKIDIEKQIYRGKYIESRNNRFANLMQAMGVSFIKDYEVRYSPSSVENYSLRESLLNKKHFVALLAAGVDCTKDTYSETLQKVGKLLEDIKFVQEEGISLVCGDKCVKKKVYSKQGEFHYVGQWSIANIELLHHDIAKYLTITGGKPAFMAILQMNDFYDIRDYLNEKRYNISLIPDDAEPIKEIAVALQSISGEEKSTAIISLSDTPYAGLSKEQMGDSLKEAKEAVKERMENEGFEFKQGLCEGCYGNIYGVMKDGVEYPLVVHSYKSNNRPFQLTAFDWEQLARPNSMLWLNTYDGVKCIPFYALAKDRGTINISFAAENFDIQDRSIALAQVLRYFKGLHFDFGTMLPNCSSQIVLFNKPEKPIREALNVKDANDLL